uniref:Secreted protein n=1 Tax=Plectus sambesii TaxID=2011161 RepID=A0A914WU15_9BILA
MISPLAAAAEAFVLLALLMLGKKHARSSASMRRSTTCERLVCHRHQLPSISITESKPAAGGASPASSPVSPLALLPSTIAATSVVAATHRMQTVQLAPFSIALSHPPTTYDEMHIGNHL